MAGIRELLAVVLGVGLGLVLLFVPRVAIQLSVAGGPSSHRRGEYGTDGEVGETWTWVVRALGVACLAVAGVVAYRAYL